MDNILELYLESSIDDSKYLLDYYMTETSIETYSIGIKLKMQSQHLLIK